MCVCAISSEWFTRWQRCVEKGVVSFRREASWWAHHIRARNTYVSNVWTRVTLLPVEGRNRIAHWCHKSRLWQFHWLIECGAGQLLPLPIPSDFFTFQGNDPHAKKLQLLHCFRSLEQEPLFTSKNVKAKKDQVSTWVSDKKMFSIKFIRECRNWSSDL